MAPPNLSELDASVFFVWGLPHNLFLCPMGSRGVATMQNNFIEHVIILVLVLVHEMILNQ